MNLVQNGQSVIQVHSVAKPRLARSEAGQALVETALVIPICIALILGAVELARIAYASIEIANAARAGVAFAAQNRADANTTNPNITLAAKQEAADLTTVTATSLQTCSCSDGSGSAGSCGGTTPSFDPTKCSSTAQILDQVTVNVTGTMNTLFGVPGIPSSLTLTSSATMVVEQE
jgi:Flp pilus assembly protein TadG